MPLNAEWFKSHWYYIVGGLLGVFVLYELVESLGGSSSSSASSSSDVSGSADQLASLSAAADLQDAQVNGAVEQSSYAANVANNQTAAALQLGEVQTAAQLSATQQQTSAAETVDLGEASDAVQAQSLVTQGQVQQTQIEGDTLESVAQTAGQTQVAIAKVQASVPLAEINNANSQIMQIQDNSKNAAKDYAAFTPLLAVETGQASSAKGLQPAASPSTAAVATAGISSILQGLLG